MKLQWVHGMCVTRMQVVLFGEKINVWVDSVRKFYKI